MCIKTISQKQIQNQMSTAEWCRTSYL